MKQRKAQTNMKRIYIAVTLVGFLGVSLSALAQVGGSGRIATVDLNKIFNEYYKTPVASGKLKDTAESYNKEHEDMLAQYRKQVDELNKLREEQDKPEYTPEVREQKKKAVQEKLAETQKAQRDIEEYRNSHRQILEQQTQRMRQGILKEINDVIGKEARNAGYSIVFDKSGNTLNGTPSIVFAQDTLDITDEIIKTLNKNKLIESAKPEEKAPDKPADKK
jgi:outer membrane protein